jgi:hypothetical protein
VNEAFVDALGVLGQKLDFLSTSALAQVRRFSHRVCCLVTGTVRTRQLMPPTRRNLQMALQMELVACEFQRSASSQEGGAVMLRQP